ncbi:MAG: hypothetical protein KDC95_13925 [Planctomycetes bacterium]|nr:hypothetical protein [Planctomycetota bacterium]
MTGKRFKLDPDPPIAGKPLEITYVGRARVIMMQIDDRPEQRLKPDEQGRITISSVGSGDEFMLSDRDGLDGYVHRQIQHLG